MTDNNKQIQNIKSSNFISSIIILALTVLYVLFINKLAEIMSTNEDDIEQTRSYALIIYFISIIGMVIGFIWFNDSNSNIKNQNGNFIIRWSLNLGGILLLIYTMTNYWEFLDNYSKLVLISIAIMCIIYYIYQFY